MKRRPAKKSIAVSQHRWIAYAAAGLATAAGSASTAEAEIHYSGKIHLKLTGTDFISTFNLPLTGDAHIFLERGATFGGEYDSIAINGALDGEIRRAGGFGNAAAKLALGQKVYSGRFETGEAGLIEHSFFGRFREKGVGFVGFKFDVGNGVQYGWVRIKTIEGGPDNKLVVTEYAWADPGEEIRAGRKFSTEDALDATAVPSEGSLGLLALGSAGLLAWRRGRHSPRTCCPTRRARNARRRLYG